MKTLTKLKIHSFPNTPPGLTLKFNPNHNILLGQNGTGKTTLLKLISRILAFRFSDLKTESFHLEFELQTNHGRFLTEIQNTPTPPANLNKALRLSPEHKTSPFQLTAPTQSKQAIKIVFTPDKHKDTGFTIHSDPDSTTVTTQLNKKTVTAPALQYTFEDNLLLTVYSALFGQLTEEERLQLAAPIVSALSFNPQRFDESLDTFRELTQNWGIRAFAYTGTAKFAAAPIAGNAPFQLLNLISEAVQENPSLDSVRFPHTHPKLPFLAKLVELFNFASAELKLELSQKKVGSTGNEFVFEKVRFDFTKHDGSIINHDLLSFGQKRMLAFFYLLACDSETVIADELVNGLHHKWIEACLGEIGSRQAFLTSQNPLLLDHLSFENADQARESFILCRSKSINNKELMTWKNMNADDASMFFSAYSVGIEHVSEILRTRGLW